ncbi:MAG: ATP-dependent Clp protease adaptor ClpS [Pirellulales bacterium]
MADESRAAVAEPVAEPTVIERKKERKKPKHIPRYHVILWDDQDHTFEYVIAMMQELFGHPFEHGFLIAEEVHQRGRAIVLTTTKEHAELKRDQIHAYGKDPLTDSSAGSMWSSIEAAPE